MSFFVLIDENKKTKDKKTRKDPFTRYRDEKHALSILPTPWDFAVSHKEKQ